MDIRPSPKSSVNQKQSMGRDEEVLQKKLQEVATGIEEQFASMLIQEMKRSVDKTEEDSSAMKIYESYLDQEYARILANQKTLGLSDIIIEQLAPSLKATKPQAKPNQFIQGGAHDRN